MRSGAPPPPTVRPLGGLSGSVIHSCCGRRCAGVGPGAVPSGCMPCEGRAPGGWPATVASSVWCQALSPPRSPALWAGRLGSATHMLWARVCGCWGPALAPSACMPCGSCVPRGRWVAAPGGGWPATVVRGVWCQTLSLPMLPALWSQVPGAVSAGLGTQHRPDSVRPCGPALLAVGVAEGRPRGSAFHRCEGRLRSGAPPPPTARQPGGLLGSATRVLWARACGCGGPTLSPWPARPVGAACCGGGGGPSLGGGVACHCCEGRLVSGAVPPPTLVLWGGQPGFRDPCVPAAVGAGVGTQHLFHSVRPCGPALLAVGPAEGRPGGGCLPPW